jgi:hypothetical protein
MRRWTGSLVLFSLAALSASAADLYGKPLRGLSPVAARAIVADPARYAAKAVRVEGANAGRARASDSSVVFVATGVEVRRAAPAR